MSAIFGAVAASAATDRHNGANGERALELAKAHSVEEIDALARKRDEENRASQRFCLKLTLWSIPLVAALNFATIKTLSLILLGPAMFSLFVPLFSIMRWSAWDVFRANDRATFDLARRIRNEIDSPVERPTQPPNCS